MRIVTGIGSYQTTKMVSMHAPVPILSYTDIYVYILAGYLNQSPTIGVYIYIYIYIYIG